MKAWIKLALRAGLAGPVLGVAALAQAGAPQTAPSQQLASAAGVSAPALAATLARSVAAARTAGQASGATPEALELQVAEALEADIIESAAAPLVVQEALQLTLAAERCVLTDRAAGAWSRPGCAAVADLLAIVTTALGGPAAARTTGGVAGPATGAPPVSAAGSDYADD